ncbi:MAG: helix-turn-helix domain-containing protein [Acidimicrobiales bacterium]
MTTGGPMKTRTRAFLSVNEAAILLGESRSTLYRSIDRGDMPLPVVTINGRLRIPRRAVVALMDESEPMPDLAQHVPTGSAATRLSPVS